MHLLKWLYPGMHFKRWMLVFGAGVMMVSLGLALVFNYKYLDIIEEAIFRAVYLWRGSFDYVITTIVGIVIVVLGLALMLFATRFVIRSVISVLLPDNGSQRITRRIQCISSTELVTRLLPRSHPLHSSRPPPPRKDGGAYGVRGRGG